MVETDPIHDIERSLADKLARVHRRALGVPEAQVQVHFRDETIVCLVESDGLPPDLAGPRDAIEVAFDEAVHEMLGRRVARPLATTRLSPTEVLAVVRLI
jgi:hypothetical protein